MKKTTTVSILDFQTEGLLNREDLENFQINFYEKELSFLNRSEKTKAPEGFFILNERFSKDMKEEITRKFEGEHEWNRTRVYGGYEKNPKYYENSDFYTVPEEKLEEVKKYIEEKNKDILGAELETYAVFACGNGKSYKKIGEVEARSQEEAEEISEQFNTRKTKVSGVSLEK